MVFTHSARTKFLIIFVHYYNVAASRVYMITLILTQFLREILLEIIITIILVMHFCDAMSRYIILQYMYINIHH